MNEKNEKIISENNVLICQLTEEIKDIQKSINNIDIEYNKLDNQNIKMLSYEKLSLENEENSEY